MKILLVGHDYSKMILPTSSWLWKKYGADGFDIEYLNFGEYEGELYKGKFVSLAEEQVGGKKAWGKYITDYVKKLRCKHVVLGCDDFLLNQKINIPRYKELLKLMGGSVKAARLCDITWYPQGQYNCDDRGMVSLKRKADYNCTGQLTIWNREALLELLGSGDIWDFESSGSKKMKDKEWDVIASYDPPFKYYTISALSGGDNKIDLGGLKESDKKYIIKNLITKGDVK